MVNDRQYHHHIFARFTIILSRHIIYVFIYIYVYLITIFVGNKSMGVFLMFLMIWLGNIQPKNHTNSVVMKCSIWTLIDIWHVYPIRAVLKGETSIMQCQEAISVKSIRILFLSVIESIFIWHLFTKFLSS